MTTTAHTDSTAGLHLSGVELAFRDGDETLYALAGIDLEVARGEILAVVGPSGAGKSSLLAVAGGILYAGYHAQRTYCTAKREWLGDFARARIWGVRGFSPDTAP